MEEALNQKASHWTALVSPLLVHTASEDWRWILSSGWHPRNYEDYLYLQPPLFLLDDLTLCEVWVTSRGPTTSLSSFWP